MAMYKDNNEASQHVDKLVKYNKINIQKDYEFTDSNNNTQSNELFKKSLFKKHPLLNLLSDLRINDENNYINKIS